MTKEQKDIKLKVMEALQEEAYKGIVRIDTETMHNLGVHAGDVISITGARTTVAIADRAYPTDVGQQVIRMDGIMRRNAKTSIGEFIDVKKAEVKEAKSVTIAPAQKGVMVKADPRIFRKTLLGRAVVKGDIIVPGGARSRHRAMSESPFFEEVFSLFEESFTGGFGLGGLKFIVAQTLPKDNPLIICLNKRIIFMFFPIDQIIRSCQPDFLNPFYIEIFISSCIKHIIFSVFFYDASCP